MVYSNARVASTMFLGGLVADCLTATESSVDRAAVPTSLRATGLVLVALLAAPIVRHLPSYTGFYQRPVIASLLLAASIGGLHHGVLAARTADASYTTLVGLAVIVLYSAGGIDESALGSMNKESLERAIARSSSVLAASLLFYSSGRVIRAGALHSTESLEFRVSVSGLSNTSSLISTSGLSHASDTSAVSVSIGGALGLGAATLVLFHGRSLEVGTGVVAWQLGILGVAMLACALVSALSYSEQLAELPTVFISTGCLSGDACEAASKSRRFALANTQSGALLMNALGLFALAYPPSGRLKSSREQFSWSWTAWVLGGLTAAACVAAIYLYSDGLTTRSDLVAVAVVGAILVSAFGDDFVGTLVYVAAFGYEEVSLINEYGLGGILVHFTHLTLLVSFLLLIAYVMLRAVTFVYIDYPPFEIEQLIGFVTVAGTSLALFLFTASTCLLISSNGSLPTEAGDVEGLAIKFVLQHFVQLVIWSPLYACRCETELLHPSTRFYTWLGSPFVLLLIYAFVLFWFVSEPPTADLIDVGPVLAGGFGVAVLPWAAASTL